MRRLFGSTHWRADWNWICRALFPCAVHFSNSLCHTNFLCTMDGYTDDSIISWTFFILQSYFHIQISLFLWNTETLVYYYYFYKLLQLNCVYYILCIFMKHDANIIHASTIYLLMFREWNKFKVWHVTTIFY